MAGLSITGQMKVSTLQEGFLKEFGLTLRVYDGREFADPTQTLGQVRKQKGSGKALSVAKNMKVGNRHHSLIVNQVTWMTKDHGQILGFFGFRYLKQIIHFCIELCSNYLNEKDCSNKT